jgi:hypothetical protein
VLTVLMASARAPRCFTHHPDWNQFDVLARCLEAQSHRDFQLVVVTPFVGEAGSTLRGRVENLTVVAPRDTPWRRARMFAVASARNTGLVHARGDWTLVVDDCSEFGPDFLARIVEWGRRGYGVAVMYRAADGRVNDTRVKLFESRARGGDTVFIRHGNEPTPHGYVSFPTQLAEDVNGYDEIRYDGARGLEDMNFARRLIHRGVTFVMDRHVFATLHDHLGYPEEVIANEDQVARCCNTAHALSRMGPANRERYTAEEKQKILHCMYWRSSGRCGFHGRACAYPAWAADGHPVAREVLLGDQEELFDLAAARRANGL